MQLKNYARRRWPCLPVPNFVEYGQIAHWLIATAQDAIKRKNIDTNNTLTFQLDALSLSYNLSHIECYLKLP